MANLYWDEGHNLPTVQGSVEVVQGGRVLGASSIKINNTSSAAFVRYDLEGFFSGVRFYFRTPTVWSTNAINILALRPNGTDVVLQIALAGQGAPGQIRFTKIGGAVMAQSAAGLLQPDTVYRLDVGVSVQQGFAYEANIFGLGQSQPMWTALVSLVDHPEIATTINRVDIGRVNNSPTLPDWFIDAIEIGISDTAMDWKKRHPSDPATVLPEPENNYPLYWVAGNRTAPPDRSFGSVENQGHQLVITQPNAGPSYAEWDLANVNRLTVATTFRTPASWASAAWAIATVRPNASGIVASAVISGAGQPGQIRLAAAGITKATSRMDLVQLGTNYTAVLQIDVRNAMNPRSRVMLFDVAHLKPLWDSGWVTDTSLTTFNPLVRYLQVGRITANPQVGMFTVSDVAIHASVDGFDMRPMAIGAMSNPTYYVKTASGLRQVSAIRSSQHPDKNVVGTWVL